MKIQMEGVREYAEDYAVHLVETDGYYVSPNAPRPGAGRLAVRALNEGGHNCTEVDLLDLIAWLKANRPELLR
jgi:hypothetical protein